MNASLHLPSFDTSCFSQERSQFTFRIPFSPDSLIEHTLIGGRQNPEIRMKSRAEILSILKTIKPELSSRYHIQSLGIFGSVARNAHTSTSDVDILVEFERPVSGFSFVHLRDMISSSLGMNVDLVTPGGLHPLLADSILGDVVYV
jgi:hypothetical protein